MKSQVGENEFMKQLIDIGDPNAPQGSEPWCRSFHLALCRLKHEGEFAVSNLKYSLREFHDGNHFMRLADNKGRSFPNWEKFVEFREPYGLGMPIEIARSIMEEQDDRRLLKDVLAARAQEINAKDRVTQRPVGGQPGNENAVKRAQAIEAIDQASLRPSGKPKTNVNSNNSDVNIRLRPTGNSAAAAHRRLRKDRPDLHARVLAGELSANAAMIEAGFRKRAVRKTPTPFERILKLLPTLTPIECRQLIEAASAKLNADP
jgi:hypothetical protein